MLTEIAHRFIHGMRMCVGKGAVDGIIADRHMDDVALLLCDNRSAVIAGIMPLIRLGHAVDRNGEVALDGRTSVLVFRRTVIAAVAVKEGGKIVRLSRRGFAGRGFIISAVDGIRRIQFQIKGDGRTVRILKAAHAPAALVIELNHKRELRRRARYGTKAVMDGRLRARRIADVEVIGIQTA